MVCFVHGAVLSFVLIADKLVCCYSLGSLHFAIDQLQLNGTEISNENSFSKYVLLGNASVFTFVKLRVVVSPEVAPVNAVPFRRLAVQLIHAYLVVLTRSYLRFFDRGWGSSKVPEEHARAREIRSSSNP